MQLAFGSALLTLADPTFLELELVFLQAQSCDEAQGYYFWRPMPAAEFARLLDAGIPGAEGVLRRAVTSGSARIPSPGSGRGTRASR